MKMKIIKLATALLLSTAASSAEAAQYKLSYTEAGGGVVGALVTGTLQADHNTVVVTSIADFATFNGTPGAALPALTSGTNHFYSNGKAPTLSLDGSDLDLLACDSGVCYDGFAFEPAGLVSPFARFASGPSFGLASEAFDVSKYSLTAVAAPEPAVWALMLVGMGVVGFAMRRRAKVTVSYA
jgi:hypothetical protein